ncbi:MAG: thioredoxin family protein [Methanocorpusculum sp.]|nr:thioredoxin family protein [Methanocorpusculum sp.]
MSKPVLYDFFATWCGPCRIQSPIIHKLAEKLGDSVDVRMIDVDNEPELSNKYSIAVVPTIIIEKDGRIIERHEGVVEGDRLEALLKPLM